MLTLVARRAAVQWRVLVGVVALVTAGATLLGVCALLLGTTQDLAFTRGVQRADPADLEVTAFLVTVAGKDGRRARQDAQAVITSSLAPLASTTTSNAVSALRQLDSAGRRAYLGSSDDLTDRAQLVSGHWPRTTATGSRAEAVVPETTARLLRLTVGQHVTLGRETGPTDVRRPTTVVVVGTFRPRSQSGWARDPLSGKGFDARYNDGRASGPTYGPFMVEDDALLSSGSTLDAVQVTAAPVVGSTTEAALSRVATAVDAADDRLTAVLDDRARISRVASDLPQTLADIRAQQAATRSTVLVVVLLGGTLAIAALLLAGRLLAVFRADERALLLSLGQDRRQLVLAAASEALLLGGAAALLAVPAAALLHSALTHLPPMAAAGLSQPPTLTTGLLLTVLVGALVLASALVVPTLRGASALSAAPRSTTVARGHVALAARSGLDLLLLTLAAAAWWQLRSQPAAPPGGGDVVRTVAPVLVVIALALVAVRLVPLLLSLATRPARRSRRLLLPLAAYEAARRPHPVTASLLLAVAAAAGTFALSLGATWERSQADQAAVQVGTDLTVALVAAPTTGDAAAVTRASGGLVSAVTARPVALGQFVGDRTSVPQLVAVDARHAGALLRGRLDDGRTWAGIGDVLTPRDQVVGVPLPDEAAGVLLSGTVPGRVAVTATPTMVLQDASGLRTSVAADPVPLDAHEHSPRWRSPIGSGQQVVAVQLALAADSQSAPPDDAGTGEIAVALHVPTTSKAAAGQANAVTWTARSLGDLPTAAESATASVAEVGGGTVIRASTRLSLAELAYVETDLLASAFEPPSSVPVAISRQLADSVGTKVGGGFTATVDGVDVPVQVAAIVPTVPSAPGQLAVLADADTLSRNLIGAGQLEPVVDAWWVGNPRPGASSAVRALGLGEVTTRSDRAAQLARGPLRVSVSAALVTLVVAALLLLLAGTGLLLTADLETRAVELARLRALGLTRRQVRGLLVGQHGAVLTLLVVLGTLVGAVASYALGPSLVRSDLGGAPLQPVLVQWPWPAEVALFAGLVLGCLGVASGVAWIQVRRSDTAHLRTGDA